MKLENVTEGKITLGSTTYRMVEAKYGGVVVWPTSYVISYAIVSGSIQRSYSSGSSLNAAGTNYATFTGSVQEYHNGTAYGQPFTATLTPRLLSGSPLILDGNKIYGPDLYQTPTSVESYTVALNYANSGYSSGTVTQEANVKTLVSIGEKQYDYGHSTTTTTDNNYYLESFTASPYNGSSYPIPAAGGSSNKTTLSYYAGHVHTVTTYTPWEQYANYSFTSGASSAELYDSGTEQTGQTSTPVTDTPTIAVVSGGTGFSRSGNEVTAEYRGTTTGPARSVTYQATNNGITRTVTIYQEANVATTTYVYDLSIAIDYNGNLPYTAYTYVVAGRSKRTPTTTYTSGAPPETGYPQSTQSTISVVNCTAHDGNNNPVTYVSGDFGFALSVTQNGSSQRTVSVTITADADNTKTATDSRTQEAQPAAPYIRSAELRPFIATFNGGNFVNGHTYVMFDITGAYNVTSATLQSVNFLYKVNNGVEYTIPIGQLQVTQQSSSDLPELVPASGYTLPLFKVNETYGYNDRFVSGDTVYVRFTVGNTGIIDTLTLPTDTSFTIT